MKQKRKRLSGGQRVETHLLLLVLVQLFTLSLLISRHYSTENVEEDDLFDICLLGPKMLEDECLWYRAGCQDVLL